jgi:hypothetical protein
MRESGQAIELDTGDNMLDRRWFVTAALAGFSGPGLALASQGADDAALALDIPPQEGFADFSGVWSSDTENSPTFFAAIPDIPTGLVEELAASRFKTAGDITEFFKSRTGTTYIGWFNTNVASKGAWIGKRMATGAEADFLAFWDSYLAQRALTAFELIAYMSVFANEAGGSLRSRTEGYGAADHPGIAYLFDTVYRTAPDGTRWRKQTYNRGPGNRTAAALFSDPKYIAAHGELSLGAQLVRSNDPVWGSDVYPVGAFPSKGAPANFITEADFFKFRGRGLIQTTWRANYAPLVKFVRDYKGDDPVLVRYREAWSGVSEGDACTMSSSSDWDAIFDSPTRSIVSYAVIKHAQDGGYLPLATTTKAANAKSSQPGSLTCMGRRIGGSEHYGATLKSRVRQICIALL